MTTMIIGFSQFVINILLPSTDAFTRIRAVNERQVSHCPEKALKDSTGTFSKDDFSQGAVI